MNAKKPKRASRAMFRHPILMPGDGSSLLWTPIIAKVLAQSDGPARRRQ
jgi:hypothetical protein